MLPIHVALLSESHKVSYPELMDAAAALQKQVTRDFGPIWNVQATVNAFAYKAPVGYWPITIKDKLDDPTAGGYHDDDHGQPYAYVLHDDYWTLSASHELLEMLADPFGRRMVAVWMQGERANLLVEACDPCEGDDCAYEVNGVLVSDFVTPAYFGPVTASPRERYCFSGRLDGPRQLHRDGYYSWMTPVDGCWYQKTWFDPKAAHPVIENLGKLEIRNGNCRAAVDAATRARRATHVGA